jgi:hypothetical protein
MMRILSEEESIQSEKEINEWILSLNFNTKARLKEMLEPIIRQSNCTHEWIDPNTYENNLDKSMEYCRLCNLTKPK